MANNNASPIITAYVADTNADTIALTGDKSKLVRYYSNALAQMFAVAQNGAAIDNDLYVIRNGNRVSYSQSHTFNGVESNEFRFSAADSLGNVGSAVVTPTMVNYVKLTCNMENTRPDANGNMEVQCTGNFFNASFGAVTNTLEVKCRYMRVGTTYSDWMPMTIVNNGNYYGAYTTFTIPNFVYRVPYVFECQAVDKLSTVTATPITSISTPVFHWDADDFVFEVPVTFNAGMTDESTGTRTINGDLNVTGDLRLKGDGNYGNTLCFGDGDHCKIYEGIDDVITIKASRINLDSSNIYANGYQLPTILQGTWTPSLNSSYISSYSTRNGWYIKVGNTVTVGFYIKATCLSGGETTPISITGMPHAPTCSGSGGGICSGVYVSAGFTFQCFVAETSGSITTRVQGCDHASATNLGTSSIGCRYRQGGGEITLSGTITFLTNG